MVVVRVVMSSHGHDMSRRSLLRALALGTEVRAKGQMLSSFDP